MARAMNDPTSGEINIPERIPLLPLQDTVIFPMMRLQLTVERDFSLAAVQQALLQDRLIFLVAQREASSADPTAEDLYQVGTICILLHSMPQEHGAVILVQGISRAFITTIWPERTYRMVSVEHLHDVEVGHTVEERALVRNVVERFGAIALSGDTIPQELVYFLQGINDPVVVAFSIAGNLRLSVLEAQSILESTDPARRLLILDDILSREAEVVSMQNRLKSTVDEEIKKHQKEYYLREQLKAIQNELGGSSARSDISEMKEKIVDKQMPEVAEKEALRQLARLERMPQEGPEAESVRNYLDWMIDLPWNTFSDDSIDIGEAREVLDEDHAFLEKIKERILEFLAVHKLQKTTRGSIICFVGPPGVGKTSLGKSIARAMGRNFVRISLGGIHDEADIRGHRRTYIGAMPGRIIYSLKQAGTKNPVFMLDEIDKIGSDFRGGDPYSALLEVLDPEQNNSFTDHYLNVPFDLSNIVFITTANTIERIPPPLLDRMEMIHLAGYTEEEKLDIALRYLVPRQIEKNGLEPAQVAFMPEAIGAIISRYTREAGLRNLERGIGKICRKIAKKVAEGSLAKYVISAGDVEELMGEPPRMFDTELEQDEVGTATGLAWTPAGGEILFVEAIAMEGKPTLHLTGSLGEVMKESADAALSYIRANADRFNIPAERFRATSLHIHVPAGALPKDGPSAGITMATAVLSTLIRKPVRREVAMTGEITLRGKVLPIGGIKEKILGAVRAGIRVIMIPEGNVRDLADIPQQILQKVEIIPVRSVDDVFEKAFVAVPARAEAITAGSDIAAQLQAPEVADRKMEA
ncbi:endopeptidase La [Geobacter sp. DSM 9736]|uniref:endopeptidase La n=1 Tax=Geobacter sp. DSM 9736 TaxID=1277350 RepID=UPI000B511049|nr:endopeptidase La [Geobacter sp. DSM 9736]SNB45875.1 ATP-dependent Lon protease [Geobacter sp. DSM 9736]